MDRIFVSVCSTVKHSNFNNFLEIACIVSEVMENVEIFCNIFFVNFLVWFYAQ